MTTCSSISGEVSMADFHLHDVRVWRAVVRLASFSGAARDLHTSPSAVTRAVDRLEEQLGASLLVRTTRRVYPTAAGERFLDHSEALLDAGEQAAADVSLGTAVRGVLRLTASATFGRAYLVPMIVEYLERYPDTEVDARFTDTIVDLVGEGLDLAVRIGPQQPSGLVMRTLCAERRVLCASPAYLARRGTPTNVHELPEHDCIALGGERGWPVIDCGQQVVLPVRGRLRANYGEAGLAAVETGFGIARLSLWLAAPSIQAGRLVPLLVEQTPRSHGVIAALYPRRRFLPARVRAFVDLLEERLREPPWESVLS